MNGSGRGLWHWLVRPWRLTFDYSGRSPRREFGLFVVQFYAILMLMGIGLALSAEWAERKKDQSWGPLFITAVAVTLLMLLPWLAAAVRRVHDHNKTGWLILLILVPGVGWIFCLILMLVPGSEGENLYGPDPRDPHMPQSEVSEIFS